jgi:hypothetical protein
MLTPVPQVNVAIEATINALLDLRFFFHAWYSLLFTFIIFSTPVYKVIKTSPLAKA